ncbi:glutathione S-transferase N-terminal domain-containing protein [Gammaproteobacteria bacterium]|nr:glutathione S-transferase N-terminal domain-containing protein [Gammaproteobacteria bacterium]|tara:strand:- start:1461 stop:2108 length:648 start_codon:yes stop_codon:yes gene_type:complete
MKTPILYSFKRCPYAMRARMALKLANIECELREVKLSNKPDHMLEVSPKGTVPVLILEDKVIDESIEIVNWVLSLNNIFEGNISNQQTLQTENLIKIFDSKFKYHLDRYKYSTRYENVNTEEDRSECLKILIEIENLISKEEWFFGKKINKLDISILPFIRQFRIADEQWFDEQLSISSIQKVLFNFLDSDLFQDIMFKYEVWEEGSTSVYFPKI